MNVIVCPSAQTITYSIYCFTYGSLCANIENFISVRGQLYFYPGTT